MQRRFLRRGWKGFCLPKVHLFPPSGYGRLQERLDVELADIVRIRTKERRIKVPLDRL